MLCSITLQFSLKVFEYNVQRTHLVKFCCVAKSCVNDINLIIYNLFFFISLCGLVCKWHWLSARLVNLACAHFFFCICVGQGEAAVAARQQPSRAAAVIVRSTVSFCCSCCCWFYSLLSSLCLLLFCSFC